MIVPTAACVHLQPPLLSLSRVTGQLDPADVTRYHEFMTIYDCVMTTGYLYHRGSSV